MLFCRKPQRHVFSQRGPYSTQESIIYVYFCCCRMIFSLIGGLLFDGTGYYIVLLWFSCSIVFFLVSLYLMAFYHLPYSSIFFMLKFYLVLSPFVFLSYWRNLAILTHLSLMDLPTIINWTNQFQILGVLGAIFHFYSNFDRIFCKQTVETLIRRSILRRLIWVCFVCLCPQKGL